MTPDNPFDGGKPRPIATVLDSLRARIDAERFDGVVLWLEAVAADLGYGDVRPLPGAVAWIRELRDAEKKIGLAAGSAILVDVAPAGIQAGREAGFDLLIGVARNLGSPEDLRQAGADMVVADLQELLGSARGLDR